MSIPATHPTAKAASDAGWFSRRHRTPEEHRKEQHKREMEEQERLTRISAQLQRTIERKEKEKEKEKQ